MPTIESHKAPTQKKTHILHVASVLLNCIILNASCMSKDTADSQAITAAFTMNMETAMFMALMYLKNKVA